MATRLGSSSVPIERIDVSAYKVPTDSPESDGTYEWSSTTMVLVEASGSGETGLGYSYADTATARLVRDLLAGVVKGRDAMAVPGAQAAMIAAVCNLGRPGIGAMAISAVDAAPWDLKAQLLEVALVTLLGAVRDNAPVYGSGGFTSYSPEQLRDQLGGWAAAGISMVQMPALNTPQFGWVKSRLPRRPQPVPPIFQPEVAAEAIAWAADHDRRELYVGWPTFEAIVGNKIAPGWLDHYLARNAFDSQMTDEPEDPDRPDNLRQPLPDDQGAHGRFDARARSSSCQLWADMHRGWPPPGAASLDGPSPPSWPITATRVVFRPLVP